MYEFHFYFPHFFTCQGCGGDNPPAGSVDYPGVIADSTREAPMYWDKAELALRLQPAVDFRVANSVRVIAGEFGCDTMTPQCVPGSLGHRRAGPAGDERFRLGLLHVQRGSRSEAKLEL
jgi:hypothetical protein